MSGGGGEGGAAVPADLSGHPHHHRPRPHRRAVGVGGGGRGVEAAQHRPAPRLPHHPLLRTPPCQYLHRPCPPLLPPQPARSYLAPPPLPHPHQLPHLPLLRLPPPPPPFTPPHLRLQVLPNLLRLPPPHLLLSPPPPPPHPPHAAEHLSAAGDGARTSAPTPTPAVVTAEEALRRSRAMSEQIQAITAQVRRRETFAPAKVVVVEETKEGDGGGGGGAGGGGSKEAAGVHAGKDCDDRGRGGRGEWCGVAAQCVQCADEAGVQSGAADDAGVAAVRRSGPQKSAEGSASVHSSKDSVR